MMAITLIDRNFIPQKTESTFILTVKERQYFNDDEPEKNETETNNTEEEQPTNTIIYNKTTKDVS